MSPKPAISLLNVDEDSQDSINEIQICSISSSVTKTKIHRMECDLNCDLTFDDLRLLIDLFYLPYENGPSAQQIFLDFHWCIRNYSTNENVRFLTLKFVIGNHFRFILVKSMALSSVNIS